MTKISFAFVLALTSSMMTAQVANDREVLDRIRVEGLQHSDVARVFETLTVDIGPRLTASPAHKRAVEFVRGDLTAIGLSNVRVEPWKFGRGWSLEKLTIEMVEPRYLPLIGYGDAWSPPTAGEIIAMPVFAPVKTPDDVAAQKDRLKGAIFMSQPILTTFVRRDRPNPSDPQYEPNSAAYATSVGQRPTAPGAETPQQRTQRMNQAIHDAGVAVVLKPSIGEHGTVFVTGRDNRATAFPSVTLSAEHYNMIAGMLERKIPVKLRVDLRSKFYDDDDGNAYNVTAELPGTDPALRDEVVMMGGHLDSWHTGVGATDNADGSATVIEAMRILKAVGARPRRTIRVALWGGEEQGLLGSKEYVKAHYADPATMQLKPEHAKLAGYFNVDNGTGQIRGVYQQGNEAVAPIFQAWMEPFRNMGMNTLTIRNTGGTDHLSYDAVGLPGFQFIQDDVEYNTRTHHSNMDVYERVQAQDMMRNAVIVASFVYNTANRDEKLPRKPLPKPAPPAGRGTSQP